MDLDWLTNYLLAKPETVLDYPFDNVTKVYKVKGKMFALLGDGIMKNTDVNRDGHAILNLKCDPDEAIMLRDIFSSVIPGYHMNNRLWHTVILAVSIPNVEIERMIDNSFNLVVSKMTKKDQKSILIYN